MENKGIKNEVQDLQNKKYIKNKNTKSYSEILIALFFTDFMFLIIYLFENKYYTYFYLIGEIERITHFRERALMRLVEWNEPIMLFYLPILICFVVSVFIVYKVSEKQNKTNNTFFFSFIILPSTASSILGCLVFFSILAFFVAFFVSLYITSLGGIICFVALVASLILLLFFKYFRSVFKEISKISYFIFLFHLIGILLFFLFMTLSSYNVKEFHSYYNKTHKVQYKE